MAILLTPVHLLVILLHSCPPTFSSLLVLSDSRPSTLSSSGIVVLLSFSRILGFYVLSDSWILVPPVVLLQYRNVLSHCSASCTAILLINFTYSCQLQCKGYFPFIPVLTPDHFQWVIEKCKKSSKIPPALKGNPPRLTLQTYTRTAP